MAASANAAKFIARQSCVEAVNNVWYDKLHPYQTRTRDTCGLLVGILTLGLFAPFTVSYREPDEVRII